MPSLEELRQKLYGREEPEKRLIERERFRSQKRGDGAKTFWTDRSLRGEKAPSAPKRGRWFLNVFIFSFVVLAGVVLYVGYQVFFVREEVAIVIAGPDGVVAGERADFSIFVKNTGRSELKNVELTINYPDHTVVLFPPTGEAKPGSREQVTFEKIAPNEEVKHDIAFKSLGKIGNEAELVVLAIYQPGNLESRFTKRASRMFRISRVPFAVTVSGPEEISSAQDVSMEFLVDSEAVSVVSGLALRVDYPEGFEFTSADPKPDFENNIWALGDFGRGTSKKIIVKGMLRGEPEETKSFNASLGQYRSETREWFTLLEESRGPKIASPFLFLRQTVNSRRSGTFVGGELLNFALSYKNNLSKPIDGMTVAVRLSEGLVNLTTLRIDNGVYDPLNHEIRWAGATRPELKRVNPGQEGVLNFSVILRPSPPLRSSSDRNFTLSSLGIIDLSVVPEEFRGIKLRYEDKLDFKIGTMLTLKGHAAYFDSSVQNSGPLPPKVREETTYTVFWQLANQTNDAVNLEVRGGLPANVRWLGTVGEVAGSAVFNAASNEVVWNVPRLAAGAGILRPQLTLAFRVSLIPGEDQIGLSPVLVSGVRAEGVDDFTKEPLKVTVGNVTIELQQDTVRDSTQWRVVP
ncbi:MAG: hypothetical protein HYW90_01975 [Candidatus Sungbacteria bacterium]|nr:hypothetical protein [Candidatus Sungbacteria bacterium]